MLDTEADGGGRKREREGQSELMKNELCESHRCFPGCIARARGHELNLSSGPLRRDLCLNNEPHVSPLPILPEILLFMNSFVPLC